MREKTDLLAIAILTVGIVAAFYMRKTVAGGSDMNTLLATEGADPATRYLTYNRFDRSNLLQSTLPNPNYQTGITTTPNVSSAIDSGWFLPWNNGAALGGSR